MDASYDASIIIINLYFIMHYCLYLCLCPVELVNSLHGVFHSVIGFILPKQKEPPVLVGTGGELQSGEREKAARFF